MLLLKEINESVEFLTESKNGKKSYIIHGPFMVAEEKNKNGRIYPIDILREEVKKYNEQYVQQKRAFGELNHPATPTINLNLVSHLITELKEDGNRFIGKAKVLSSTPNGKIVQALIDEDCRLGISSRGLGALQDRNGTKYVTQYIITTAGDVVADPSAPGAMLDAIVENVEWFFNGASWERRERASLLVEEFKNKKKIEREEQFVKLFHNLLRT